MTFDPTRGLEQGEVDERVDTAIDDNEVVIFMKGTPLMPQCGQDFETVDTLESLDEFRTALERHSGWETIPQVFVNGEFVGGSDVVAELDERNELESVLAPA